MNLPLGPNARLRINAGLSAVEPSRPGRAAREAAAQAAPSKSVPNPYGRLGSPTHRSKVAEVVQDIKSRGLKARSEFGVQTVNGAKRTRYMDVVAIDPKTERVVEVHQVGRVLKKSPHVPVARERAALGDVRFSAKLRGAKRVYHGY